MSLGTLNDQLIHDMQDLWSAESLLERQLPRLRDAAHQRALCESLGDYHGAVLQHIGTLESLIQEQGARPDGKPCRAIEALTDANDDHLLPLPGDPAVKDAALVGAVTRIQHYKVAGYLCLLTYAQRLEYSEESDFFRRALADEATFLEQLRHAELLVTAAAEKV